MMKMLAPQILDRDSVLPLHEAAIKILDDGEVLEIDAAELLDIDIHGLQWLISANMTHREGTAPITFVSMPKNISQILDVFGTEERKIAFDNDA